MRTTAQLALAALTAAVVIAGAVATASARQLAASDPSFSVSWTSFEFATAVATIRCRITLEGSFHTRTITKVAGALIGAVTRPVVGHPCTNAEAWFDNGTEAEPLGTAPNRLPFHLTYESFAGTLPNISTLGLLLSRVSFVFQATVLGVSTRCRFGRTTDNVAFTAARNAAGGITSLAPVAGRNTFTFVDGLVNGGLCPGSMTFAGTSGALTTPPPPPPPPAHTITVTLI